jgi:hypothetical protein
MYAIRSCLCRFQVLAGCVRCGHKSAFIVMLLILAEKLLDQISQLELGEKNITSEVNLQKGLRVGEYQLETHEEQWIVYSGLLAYNIDQLRLILVQLYIQAESTKLHNHTETLKLLMLRSAATRKSVRDYAVV